MAVYIKLKLQTILFYLLFTVLNWLVVEHFLTPKNFTTILYAHLFECFTLEIPLPFVIAINWS